MWWFIIAAIIISFVVWQSQPGGGNGGGGPSNLGRINGESITLNRYQDAQREVYFRYFFGTGNWPGRGRTTAGFDVEEQTYVRLLMIQKQEQMGIHVSDDAVAKAASERLRMINRGNPVPPDVFAKQVLASEGLTLQDFERYLRHELGIQQLASVMGLGGELLTPQELRSLYEREHQELQTQAAFFAATNYLASVKSTPEQIGQFYTNQMARYRLPDRIQVNYVVFPLSNHLAEAIQKINEITNLNEILETVYVQRGGTNFYKEAKSPEEAKQQILKDEQENAALDLARRKAVDFATILYTNEPMLAENLTSLAKAHGLTPGVTPPFSREAPPAGLGVRADFIRAAYALTDEEPFSQTLLGDDGVYLISMSKRLPSEIPALDAIRDQVTKDFRYNEAFMLAFQAATNFAGTATNVTSASAFAAACAAAKVKPVTVPPFSLSTPSLPIVEEHVPLSGFKQAAFTTAIGQMSQLQRATDGAFVVFVQGKLPVDETKLAANMPDFEKSRRQARRDEAFSAWFEGEFNKVKPTIPYFQKPAQLSGAPSVPTQ